MEGVGADGGCCGHDGVAIEQVERAAAGGRRNHGDDRQSVARAPDPRGDLAPIGDEQRADGSSRAFRDIVAHP